MLLVAVGHAGGGHGLQQPGACHRWCRGLSDPNDQGGILGLASSLASLGRVVGPAWGGFLFDHFGMTVPYLSAAAMMLIAFGVSFVGLVARQTVVELQRTARCEDVDLQSPIAANPGPVTPAGATGPI